MTMSPWPMSMRQIEIPYSVKLSPSHRTGQFPIRMDHRFASLNFCTNTFYFGLLTHTHEKNDEIQQQIWPSSIEFRAQTGMNASNAYSYLNLSTRHQTGLFDKQINNCALCVHCSMKI